MPLLVENPRKRHAFTLIELLAGIAILAALVTAGVMFTSGYVTWAKQSADQQTLTVLNDALVHYKTQGGGVSGFTSGAPMGNVLGRMQQPINWGESVHQVLQTGKTFFARSLYAKGSGTTYRFTAYNNYTAETGGVNPRASISLSGNLAFGLQETMTTTSRNLTIQNTGTAPLIVSSISLPDAVFTAPSWSSGTIAPSGSQIVPIEFTPTDYILYSGNITINCNAQSGTNTIAVSGTGLYLDL